MAEKIKKGSLKPISFDTYKNDTGLTDVKVRIVGMDGVLVAGCETTLGELPVDPAELTFKKAAITANVVAGSKNIQVSPADAAKFGAGDIVTVKTIGGTGVEVFAKTTIAEVNYTSGIVSFENGAKVDADFTADTPLLELVNATGTYVGNVQMPIVSGTYHVWLSSVVAGRDYNYGMIEVVDKDITDVLAGIEEIKTKLAGGGASAWGTMHI